MTLLRDLSIQRYSVSVVEGQQVGGGRIKILNANEISWGGAKAKEEKEAHGGGWEDEKRKQEMVPIRTWRS